MASKLDVMWDFLSKRISELDARVSILEAEEAASVAFNMREMTLAEANAFIGSTSSTVFAFISDGRKPGEGAGAGTGVPAFLDQASSLWLNFNDFSQVVV